MPNLKLILYIMMAVFIEFIFIFGIFACAYQQPDRRASPAYTSASTQNKENIERGAISEGMTIAECKAAWPGRYFEWLRKSSDGWEIWKVSDDLKILYLHVKDGIVEDISAYNKHPR